MASSAYEEALQGWVISDGRRGIENQALGLAEASARLRPFSFTKHVLTPGMAFKAATPLMQFALKNRPADYGLPRETPDLVIGCGRQAIAALLAIKRTIPTCFTVYIQDPKIDPDRFDLVIAPQHDNLSGRNVETMIGSPNRVTRDEIIKETLAFETQLNRFSMPRAALLIGGPSKRFQFTQADHQNHISAANDLLSKGYSLLITTSRRTPDWVQKDYSDLAKGNDKIWLHTGEGENPYFAFLGGAEIILVTEESTNMLTEAAATGKAVFTLPLSGDAGKFKQLHEALTDKCHLHPYSGDPTAPDYPPLDETARLAEKLWAHYDRRDAVLN
ncbi:mitochondrial fission ELM1 family protein [Litorimonas sp.]|uniref:mitochondrial fission ELM1 family protein n=1 Tax=Litorimonas sp. TaxID=1892381 RepID=UPI003A888813